MTNIFIWQLPYCPILSFLCHINEMLMFEFEMKEIYVKTKAKNIILNHKVGFFFKLFLLIDAFFALIGNCYIFKNLRPNCNMFSVLLFLV